MDQVQLNNVHGGGLAFLREITGAEEQSITSTTTADAIKLLGDLLVDSHPGSLQPEQLTGLHAGDRDRMLAEVYRRIYGQRVESTVNCSQCGEAFDLEFSLSNLLESLNSGEVTEQVEQREDGSYALADGLCFRLPTAEDEYAVLGLSPENAERELLLRCIQNLPEDLDLDSRAQQIQAVMESVAPIVDLELDARCPECGQGQQVHFDLQHFLLAALSAERNKLMAEIHSLASSYGWSLADILNLPRSQRRSLAGLIETDNDLESGSAL
jgi:hypothetical protein